MNKTFQGTTSINVRVMYDDYCRLTQAQYTHTRTQTYIDLKISPPLNVPLG